jgi:phosphoribosylformylglycinamidine synthase
MIKSTLMASPDNSLIAFCDNSSAITGNCNHLLAINPASQLYTIYEEDVNPCLTAETHNYPTYYHPFEGAATGVGGRIRDSLATGRGSISSASLVGYSVNDYELLQGASDGASDYANKLGEPCIGGFLREHPKFEKPIMFSAGVGFIKQSHLFNCQDPNQLPIANDYIVKIGPPAFKIGFGGSIQSSIINDSTSTDMTAIQRGDPYNGNKVARFLERLALLPIPLIKKIHDQGAGGLGNVVTELLDGLDAVIDLQAIPASDGMDSLEIWLSEYQEQMVFICSPESYSTIEAIAAAEGVIIHRLGIVLKDRNSNINLTKKCGSAPSFTYTYNYNTMNNLPHITQYSKQFQDVAKSTYYKDFPNFYTFQNDYHKHKDGTPTQCQESPLERSFKFHLTNKIDRSVSGCVVQQSCIGPFGIPLANYSIVRVSPMARGGILSAIGESIFVGQSTTVWIDKTVAELLGNLAGIPNQPLSKIKLSANWMTNSRDDDCLAILYCGVQRLCEVLTKLHLAIDGGKDSLSMVMKSPDGKTIVSPPTLVLTSYSNVDEESILQRVSPILKKVASTLWCFELLAEFSNLTLVKHWWDDIQQLVASGVILALHDGSNIHDIVEEMTVASGIGVDEIMNMEFFAGCVFTHHYIIAQTAASELPSKWYKIAQVNTANTPETATCCGTLLSEIFDERNKLSMELDSSKIGYESCAYTSYSYKWPPQSITLVPTTRTVRVAIIRDEGSNSHREMASAFLQIPNVEVRDFTINQLLTRANISEFTACDGFVFVGGFSYGDILGSGVATAIIMKKKLDDIFSTIFADEKKFVLGVCNGCQILIKYGLFGSNVDITNNLSQKFESRWLPVNWHTPISNCADATVGIWVAHGEGRLVFLPGWEANGIKILATYTSSKYPTNPSGTMFNAIGITNRHGNHIAIMPHPERSLFKWQCEYIPDELLASYEGPYTPWIELFQNLVNMVV